jgi:hypothetical protein
MFIVVFLGFLGLFSTRECVGECLAPHMLYLLLCAFILLLLARNAIIHIVDFQKLHLGCLLS